MNIEFTKIEERSKYRKAYFARCIDCGKERQVRVVKGVISNPRCHDCANHQTARLRIKENNPRWKGGSFKLKDGYILVKLYDSDFYYQMANVNGYVLEHRLVMAMYLGRCLQIWEIVHHKNGIKNDNKIHNLELVLRSEHMQGHSRGYNDGFLKGYQDALKLFYSRA